MRRAFTSLVLALGLAVPAFAGQTATAKTAQSKAAPTAPVNLNTATQSDLEALPGVGPATAKKIIAGRPYATVADLSKAGVPKSTIDKISPMVTVGAGAPAVMPKPALAPAATPPAPPAPSAPAASKTASAPAMGTAQQPPVKGMVWVNLSTKVYHKEGDRYYGNTKNGKWMTEEDAIKAGYREAKPPAKSKK